MSRPANPLARPDAAVPVVDLKWVVLKFGSSVLRAPQDLPAALHDIYAHLRAGDKVIAVVSAFAGVTDQLLARARSAGAEGHALAEIVAAGERDSAAALANLLDEAGVPAQVLGPRELNLRASGAALEATPFGFDVERVRRALAHTPVLVVPGFIALDEHGRTVLLGRGGSDLSALFLAQRLGASCRLVKDVDGVYDRDPAGSALAHRYSRLGWKRALEVSGELVQPRAIQFAHLHHFEFEVGAAGGVGGTRIGDFTEQFATPHRHPPLEVVLLGLGTVGLGVYRHLVARPDLFHVKRVVVRDAQKPRDVQLPPGLVSTQPWEAIHEHADIVVEAFDGKVPASNLIHAALQKGRSVVTSNKAAVAARWPVFAHHAHQGRLRFSAAVGGSVPVLETLERLRRHHEITSVRGVINGTCNFILDAIERGESLPDALLRAQAAGFAEANPAADLEGFDAAYKLQLIARVAHGDEIRLRMEHSGIAGLDAGEIRAASAGGRRVRLVADCRVVDGVVRASVGAVELPESEFLAQARAEENRVEIHLADGPVVRLRGKGAGRAPTAASVLGDVFDVLRDRERDATWRERDRVSGPALDRRLVDDELALHQRVVAGE
jgi:homoserine dehydrogenase